MIEYWSWWNLSWWLSSEAGILNKSNSLKTSIIVTSVVGGYMTYIYPRKIILRIGDKRYTPNYTVIVIGDFFIHQLPLLSILYFNKPLITDKTCGKNVLIPFGIWGLLNYYRNVDVDKLYGIKMNKLVGASVLIFCGYGACYHFIQKKN